MRIEDAQSSSTAAGACHTFATADATGSVGPDFDKTLEPDADKAGKPLKTFIRESIVEPDAFVAAGFQPGVMPGDFGEKLTDQQLADVVSFLTEHRSPQR